ncbi:MAG: hypothetical protein ACAI38_06195 [Myxococcota bacterium]|nr:hypothetical protein [Myxococcota bacterium]
MTRTYAIAACLVGFACAAQPKAPSPAELSSADARHLCGEYLARGACDDAVTACVAARADGECKECDESLRAAIQCTDSRAIAGEDNGIDPESRYRLAQFFEKRELINDAYDAYAEAVRFSNGSYKPALFGVARLADRLGRTDDVADACQHFIDGGPDDEYDDARTWCVSHVRTAGR